ncbi:MAG: DNA repair exonuclease [Gudongella sp.]|nr:DNA repair exonuclease [Gudongella sp.]
MISFIHSGDIHLGTAFKTATFGNSKGEERRGELWNSFQRLIDYAIDKKSDLIILAGDLFEEDMFTIKDINKLKDIIGEAKDQRIVITAGNHDKLNLKSMYNRIVWPENTTILKDKKINKVEFDDIKVTLYGYSWANEIEDLKEQLFKIEKNPNHYNILVMHADIFENSAYLPLDLKQLKVLDMDYIALGHIHKPEFLSHNIAYCGSLEPLDFGEIGKRGFIEGKLGETHSFEFRPFSKREFYIKEFILSEDMTLNEIITKIKELTEGAYNKNFYRVILKGVMPFYIDLEDIESALREEFYHIELIAKYRRDFDIEKIKKENENNIISKYIDSFNEEDLKDETIRDAFYMGLYSLLEGGETL